ncbi:DUF262 domain-containing protein [Vibrio parahaemolyticus]|nr:DUF262 domain-containing protein [Vibrio parahaemolyticus]MBE4131184.1 DUF262 domain-containing protein [Vibrio parahaemolyticus]
MQIKASLPQQLKGLRLLVFFFENRLELNFSEYLKNQRNHGNSDEVAFKEQRLARQEAETTTVENLILKMWNNEYQLRPPYQRQEVINNKKASGIIESILLGIPLPTIFVYRRNDGICEVVDGQQRLLSILGYIGEDKYSIFEQDTTPKTDMYSKKDKNFKLAKTLPILRDYRGFSFSELPSEYQDKIWDFELSIVYINEDTNPDFDPIDLFIRLNDKSYDIKDPSFEMWNSYAEPEVMRKTKLLAQNYSDWFYYIMDDRRMKLEELLLSLAYIDYETNGELRAFEPIQIYQASGNHITFRVENPKIDHWLDKVQSKPSEKKNALDSLDNVESFIKKISTLIGDELSPLDKAKGFDDLISLTTRARNQRGFYTLWLLLYPLSIQRINENRKQIFESTKIFISQNKRLNVQESDIVKDVFINLVKDFWKKHKNHL